MQQARALLAKGIVSQVKILDGQAGRPHAGDLVRPASVGAVVA
jgi:hypothetical protein